MPPTTITFFVLFMLHCGSVACPPENANGHADDQKQRSSPDAAGTSLLVSCRIRLLIRQKPVVLHFLCAAACGKCRGLRSFCLVPVGLFEGALQQLRSVSSRLRPLPGKRMLPEGF